MRRAVILIAAAISIAVLTTSYTVLRGGSDAAEYELPKVSPEALDAVAEGRVLFAHQSVGGNILGGVPAVYAAHGRTAPPAVELSDAGPEDALVHVRIGANGDPLGKIREFDRLIRGGLGEQLDVAVLKLCYADVHEGADVHGIFTAYRDTLHGLQQDYPDVTFVAATVPLQVKRGPLGTIKAWVGQGDRLGSEHNATRDELNALLRAEYADTHLFDVASIESTTEGGDRVTARHDGEVVYALHKDYAKDPGHLNADGAAVVAEGFLAVVAGGLRD